MGAVPLLAGRCARSPAAVLCDLGSSFPGLCAQRSRAGGRGRVGDVSCPAGLRPPGLWPKECDFSMVAEGLRPSVLLGMEKP